MKTILGNESVKEYKIEFNNQDDYCSFLAQPFNVTRQQDQHQQVVVTIADADVNKLFDVLAKLSVRFISHKPYTLEACFKEVYNKTEIVKND
jgi:hypothetical protein